jgi:hypothetical protein
MLEIAENVPSPEKWRGVCNAVVKVMRSLPDLKQFQVILFAQDAQNVLGLPGEWVAYDSKTSPDLVLKTLNDPKWTPKGGTNVFDGLKASFRLRPKGLDAIYIFSDGLPSLGEGVAPDVAKTLTEVQLGERLGQHIRRTLKNDWNRELPGQPRVRINSVGFFYDSPDVGAFLWALSRENEGSFVGMSKP